MKAIQIYQYTDMNSTALISQLEKYVYYLCYLYLNTDVTFLCCLKGGGGGE